MLVGGGAGDENGGRTKFVPVFGNDPRRSSVELLSNVECVGLKFELTRAMIGCRIESTTLSVATARRSLERACVAGTVLRQVLGARSRGTNSPDADIRPQGDSPPRHRHL
ncbi:hypothetical protein NBRGN_062_00310 [Nocardia brasiliensis NBRC 14402]|nr:hypothetical protein CEQ30_31385 [Nocardia brasiliensis]GAJ83194.1 hypothetical protein NBRGN_062_00310 [Nocardia brasiliensis NBRC 14402]